MYHSPRRARRVTLVLLAALAATAGATVTSGAAGASSARARVSVRVHDRTLLVDGTREADSITLRSPAATPFVVEVDLDEDGIAEASIHRNRFDRAVVRADDGDDIVMIDETEGVAVPFTDTVPTSIRGQAGSDAMFGGSGAEEFRGGAGNDFVDGNRGNDVASLDSGDDTFRWDPGDGSDAIDGRSGFDHMVFNGNGADESFAAIADRGRLRFTRDVGNIVMDTDGVEVVELSSLAGADIVAVADLSRTDVDAIVVDDGPTVGIEGPDDAEDRVIVEGTERRDAITVLGESGGASVVGLDTLVNVFDMDAADRLEISSLGGRDLVDATAVAADAMQLHVQGGRGDDDLRGGAGPDQLDAGPGRDVVDGNRGNDTSDLAEGDDEFIWDPGDGSDLIEGRDGFDVMTFNGSDGAEIFAAEAVGDRVAFTRDLGNIRMDTAGVEQVDLNALGGADVLTVNDLTGTAVSIVDANLGAAVGALGGDAAADTIDVVGTPGDDVVAVTGAGGSVRVDGLVATLDVVNAEPADALTFRGNGGTDAVDSSGLAPGTIGFSVA